MMAHKSEGSSHILTIMFLVNVLLNALGMAKNGRKKEVLLTIKSSPGMCSPTLLDLMMWPHGSQIMSSLPEMRMTGSVTSHCLSSDY